MQPILFSGSMLWPSCTAFALAGFLSSDIMNFVNYVIAVVIAMVVTFAITFVTFKDEA